jgi:DNA-binding beta-propeller fold protein YncE
MWMGLVGVVAIIATGSAAQAQQSAATTANLPSSKQLFAPAPGDPRRLNSLPTVLAVSPDGRWVVALNQGYGTYESQYKESIAVLDTNSGAVKDFPDDRVGERASQTFFSGLAFSKDGTRVYASLASEDPADGDTRTGSGIIVYKFADGVLTPRGFLKLPDVKLAAGRYTELRKSGDKSLGVAYPAAIAVLPAESGGERLLVAENLSDSAVVMDAATGKIEKTVDLSENDAVPSTYPIALAVTKDGRRAFVALWNASEVAELDLVSGKVVRHVELM